MTIFGGRKFIVFLSIDDLNDWKTDFHSKSKKLNVIDGSIQSKEREIPEYIQLDGKSKSVKLVRVPKFSEVPYPVIMEPNLVIEYYSR